MSKIGYFEKDRCNRDSCAGMIRLHPVENCSCHINPPCPSCLSPLGYCDTCGWEEVDDETLRTVNDISWQIKQTPSGEVKAWRCRPLDKTKIDYRIFGHTNSSQICEGVYPEGATKEDVLKEVQGTFGGRFVFFREGKFKYIAYTD